MCKFSQTNTLNPYAHASRVPARSDSKFSPQSHCHCDLGVQDSEYDNTLSDFAEMTPELPNISKNSLDKVRSLLVRLYQYMGSL
jgi:hypothetical protein